LTASLPNLVMGFYGDDFTGSTDAMEALTCGGLRTVLFLEPPRLEQLARYEGLRAVGIAGCSRSLPPQRMDIELTKAFSSLRDLSLPIVHYKVCSTFDSSPQIGSIGRAIDLGAEIFAAPVVPLVAGAPTLGRHCAFGNLFARSGLDTEPFRLDRHPTMSRHPITPMNESDIRIHLSRQTARNIGLLDVLHLTSIDRAAIAYHGLVESGAQVTLIDVLYDEHQQVIGALISGEMETGKTLFVVGSSCIESSLTSYWKSQQLVSEHVPSCARAVEQLVVVSGSCSPVTDRQIARAVQNGAVEIPLNTARLVDPATVESEISSAVSRALEIYAQGLTPICHSARGPADPRLKATIDRLLELEYDAREQSGRLIGNALGTILLRILGKGVGKRVVVTGGDTSFFIARQLGIEALEVIAPVAPGAPLCRTHAPGLPFDGLEICFKGGQVGDDAFFDAALRPGVKDSSPALTATRRNPTRELTKA
jgi:uncharacterized protein YgbK (DUF1537 family)